MLAPNNSPLLKDSQELAKTKGTIWKPLIAVSSLSIFSFISGQYLPYVIAAISGSGAIVAVPLAIFTVSTAVALISTIYLIRLAVSRADNKKEEPQKFVCESCTNLENRSSVPTPTPPPVTLGIQPNPSVSVPPLPPPPLPQDAAPPPPLPPPHFFTASKRTEQPKNGAPKKAGEPENDNNRFALLKQIREGIKLKTINDGTTKKKLPILKNPYPREVNHLLI